MTMMEKNCCQRTRSDLCLQERKPVQRAEPISRSPTSAMRAACKVINGVSVSEFARERRDARTDAEESRPYVRIVISERCSITLSVVASVHVRTCIGCERKALDRVQPIATTIAEPSPLPRNTEEGEENRRDTSTSASAPPPTTQATTEVPDSLDVINAILKEATCCLYCGERWMRIR